MNCDQAQDLLDGFVDGELDLMRVLEIEQHVKECAACARAYENRRVLQRTIQAAPLRFQPPENFEDRLRKAVMPAFQEKGSPASSDKFSAPARKFNWTWMTQPFQVASLIAAGALIVVGIHLSTPMGRTHLQDDIVANHVRSLMVNHLVDVETSNQHVLKP